MLLVRIDLMQGSSREFRSRLGDAVHRALVETMNIPEHERFQVIAELTPGSPVSRGVRFGGARILIQVLFNVGRTLAVKKAFCARVVEVLAGELGVRGDDVLINLVEVAREDWCFGHGIVQYAG